MSFCKIPIILLIIISYSDEIDFRVHSNREKGRPSAVMRAVSLSHQVVGLKQPLRRFCGGKACLGFFLPQTPLMWEHLALGLPFFYSNRESRNFPLRMEVKITKYNLKERIQVDGNHGTICSK